jgi:autotransporter-associated beta strand protein
VSRVTLAGGGTLHLSADVANLTTQTLFTLGAGGGMIDNGGFEATLNGTVTAGSLTTATGITGAGGLTSSGSGTLTLTGTNTYTGNTIVSAGTLLVNGSLASNSAVTVDSAAVFGGIGTVNGNLGFHADSFFRIADLNTPLMVGGTVSFGNGFGIANLLGMNWDALTLNTPYTLITTDQTFTDSDIDNFGIGNAFDVGTGRQAYFQTGSLQVVVVPEPGSALLGGIGILMLLRRRRN